MIELVAEIGINAGENINTAKKLIDVAVAGGCQYVKFQKRDINLVYTPEELTAPRPSPFGKTNGDLKRGLEFGKFEYDEIDRYCHQRGIGWFASAWDLNSVKFLNQYPRCVFHKIASPMLTNMKYLEECVVSGKQTILSTGMSTELEIIKAVNSLGDTLYAILHCTSTYPSKPEELNLNYIKALKWTGVKVGFSNHSPGLIYMPIAVALGAQMIEFHITLDRSSWGSDQASSIEPEGVMRLAKYIKGVELALGDGKKTVYPSEIPIMVKLRRQ